jgi:hypothetical protein
MLSRFNHKKIDVCTAEVKHYNQIGTTTLEIDDLADKKIIIQETVNCAGDFCLAVNGHYVWPDAESCGIERLNDKEAERVGVYLWEMQPNNSTKDRAPNFFTYRKAIYAELDKRGITHPSLDYKPVMKEVVKEISAFAWGEDEVTVNGKIPREAYGVTITYKIKEPVK